MAKGSKFIKEQDIFGHHVALNFNKKGDTYQTLCGGLISVLLKSVILAFIIYKTLLLVGFKNNSFD